MDIINLYSIPEMDVTYENAPYFGGRPAQKSWINGKKVGALDAKISVDPRRTTVTIDKSYNWVEKSNIDYVSLIDSNGKELYYFIVDYEYKTKSATTLILQLDVIQTYMFDVTYQDSFVDRCHVNRWYWHKSTGKYLPSEWIADEGLQIGDLVTTTYKSEQFRPKYIIASTTPLGKNQWERPGTGGDVPRPSGNCWEQGQISADGFRMLKGFEGFGPYLYYDSGGVATIGYGTTAADKENFNELVASQPVPEEKAAKIAYENMPSKYGKTILDFCIKELHVDNQNKFDALLDLAYNAGPGRVLRGSLPDILKKYPNDESKVRPVWEEYIVRDAAGTRLPGLVARRRAECDVYFGKGYEKRTISIIRPGTGTVPGDGWLPEGCGGGGSESMKHFNAYGYDFIYPGHGTVTSTWYRADGVTVHGALDVACPVGTPIRATRDGVVTVVANDKEGYGLWIQIDYEDIGYCTRYAHNSQLLVKKGQKVRQGDIIAKSGNTGRSTGPHYHYELAKLPYSKANRVVPIPHLKRGDKI